MGFVCGTAERTWVSSTWTTQTTPNDYAGHPQTVRVATGHPKTVNWPTDADGYYDVTVTANTGDGFTRRYAGRIA
jgi:phospholipase C